MNWKNGVPARVVAAKGSVWAVMIQNEHGATLRGEHSEGEVAYPYPGNRRKTMAEAKRIAAAYGVPAYVRDARAGLIRIN